jgi:hypothetical protein
MQIRYAVVHDNAGGRGDNRGYMILDICNTLNAITYWQYCKCNNALATP